MKKFINKQDTPYVRSFYYVCIGVGVRYWSNGSIEVSEINWSWCDGLIEECTELQFNLG